MQHHNEIVMAAPIRSLQLRFFYLIGYNFATHAIETNWSPCGYLLRMEKTQQITRSHFHRILRQYRHQAGLTQEQMAERMNVSIGFFGMMEVGRRWPNIDMLFRIARALGVRPGELLDALEKEAQQQ